MNIEIKYNRLLEIFKDISKIPRNSKQEKKIANYIYNYAISLNLEATIDDCYNVIVKKSKNKLSNSSKRIIFQAHTDMVCEKTLDSNHNFEIDPIEIIETEEYYCAKDTTLGADDGIGVAILILLMEDKDIVLPETYFIFTTQEEIGMDGAKSINLSGIDADYMINLDIEEEDSAIVGCAGGVKLIIEKEYPVTLISNPIYELNITGLFGGHSGVDIDKNRINSNYLAALLLSNLNNVRIVSFNGGSKHNVIPSETSVIFSTADKDIEDKIDRELKSIVFTEEDKNVNVLVRKLEKKYSGLDLDISNNIINLILELKQNLIDMNKKYSDLVESSGNIGIININNGRVSICESLRSNSSRMKEFYKNYNKNLAEEYGFDVSTDGEYPSWDFDDNSKLLEIYIDSYKRTHNNLSPKVYTIHAGLECGIIKEKIKDLDIIALGPDVKDIYTINEKLYLNSCKRLLMTLIEMIKRI